MFTMIIMIISIALVAALAMATVYHGGGIFNPRLLNRRSFMRMRWS